MSKSRRLPAILAVVLILSATFGWWAWTGPGPGPDNDPPPPSPATAEIVRQDMSTNVAMPGVLGHGPTRPVKGGRPGIVTWLPAPGATVKRGATLYRVDDQPVPVFYGRTPLFRPLDRLHTVGRDVRVVAENLEALGYAVGRRYRAGERVRPTPPTPPGASAPPASLVKVRTGEDVLTAALLRAIQRWRADAGLPASSVLGVGDVAVLSGAVRVAGTTAQVGDDAEGPLLMVTTTGKVVTVEAEVAAATSLRRGVKVRVRLPDDRTRPGRVSLVSTAVTDDPDGPAKLTVTVTLDDPAAAARLDAAPVEVVFPGRTRGNVLAAPVGALVALAEGGYAVQVAGGGLVAVRTGIFAGGLVEVSGAGVAEGTRVVTTS